jgi:hypothetical protein
MKAKPTPSRDLKGIIVAHISMPTHQQQTILLSIFLGILGILILVVLGYLAMQYKSKCQAVAIPVENSHGQEIGWPFKIEGTIRSRC